MRKGNTTDYTHTYGYDLLALLKGEPTSLLFCKAPGCYERRPDLTAVFVYNDLMALGAMSALRAQGIRVPEDISIIGFDNIFYASTSEPALTTIAQPIAAMGQECIAQLLERIHLPEKQPAHIMLPVELIERSSCRRL